MLLNCAQVSSFVVHYSYTCASTHAIFFAFANIYCSPRGGSSVVELMNFLECATTNWKHNTLYTNSLVMVMCFWCCISVVAHRTCTVIVEYN